MAGRGYGGRSPAAYARLYTAAYTCSLWVKGAERVRVLLADDERLLADTVADGLRKLAMAVDVCYDGEAAQSSGSRSTATTSPCSTATCPAAPATRCAAGWSTRSSARAS